MANRNGDLLFLPREKVTSLAAGRAELARMLAGKSRWLSEFATGVSAVAEGAGNDTKRNPQSQLGHDHSGPPWGSAFRQPIAWRAFTRVSSGVQAPDPPATSSAIGNVPRLVVLRPWLVWVRPHARLDDAIAPWSRGYVTFRTRRSVSTFPHSTDMTVKAWNITKGQASDEGHADSINFGALAGTEATIESDVFVDLQPGLNLIGVSFQCTTSSHEMQILGVQLEQRAKRSH